MRAAWGWPVPIQLFVNTTDKLLWNPRWHKAAPFQIYLPASLKVVGVTVPDDEPKRFFGQGRVLIMDDEADILTLVSEMLELMGYQVEVARDGAEGVRTALSQRCAPEIPSMSWSWI